MIEIDASMLKKVEKQLGRYKQKAPTALYRTLNRAASKVKTEATKKTREEYHIKSRDVRDTMKVVKAYRTRLGALVISRGELMPLDKFRYKPKNPRPHNPPVLQVAVKRDGYKELKGAFVADIHGNKIFKRVGRSRLPIKRVMGPAIPQMLDNEEVREHTDREAANTFQKRLDHEIKRILERGR